MKKQRDALQNERKYVHVCHPHDEPLTAVLLLESAGFVTIIESKGMSFFSPLPVYYGGKKHYYNKNYRVQEKNWVKRSKAWGQWLGRLVAIQY